MIEKFFNQNNPAYAIDLFKKESDQGKWLEQKRKLPRNIRYGLISLEAEDLVKKMGEKYKLSSSEKIGSVAVLIRLILAGVLKKEQLKKEIFQRFQFDNITALGFLKDLETIIEKIKKIGIEKVKEDLKVFKFQELLEKIPEVKKQEIGIYDIFFPDENEPKKPTIENWITDYKLKRDNKQETTILNIGDYLYNNKNTQELSLIEKENLATVLNCYEKNLPTYYNTLEEGLDFEIMKILNKNKPQKEKFNITSFESKPYHDSDKTEINNNQEKKADNFFKPNSENKTETNKNLDFISPQKENQPNSTSLQQSSQRNVLDLNNYN